MDSVDTDHFLLSPREVKGRTDGEWSGQAQSNCHWVDQFGDGEVSMSFLQGTLREHHVGITIPSGQFGMQEKKSTS